MQAELDLFRKSIEAFAEKHIAPYFDQWEKEGNTPRELWNKLGEEGFLCVDIPEEYGGLGVPYQFAALVVEEFNRLGYGSISVNISVHANIVSHYILSSGTEEQKLHYLPKMVTGEIVGAIAMTEPNAGSDLQGMKATAVYNEADETYTINGAKTFITNGEHSDLIIVAARTDSSVRASKGTSLFLVDAPIEGFERGTNLDKIGLLSCDTMELFFEDVVVGKDKLLGELHGGFITLMKELPKERLSLAAGALGALEGALEWTIQYVKERQAFGQPLSNFQNTRYKIAEMKTEAAMNRAFIEKCYQLLDRGELDTATASMAKLACTEAQGRIVDECLQLFGGYGYMREYPIARAFVDARVQRIYGGTSEIMKEIISRDIFGR
ncbi:acyl-CoA dehydrogenase family protein [Savagea sp. SN6]|uniref:Acyl-CoA dehydrogenase family protein n=1 Tax=Savagea serpentis TaxID=2785297 RepID=A0A8J7G701_9BACL|nr:acyl-CoA dehydrogenase family protein [Savagea serpentis]MBF4500328.1 acyl-CoA dehydrogenase family protein [Savagea serpentis]